MAMTLDQIEGLLGQLGVKYRREDEKNHIGLAMSTKKYRPPEDESFEGVVIFIKLEEDGEYIKIFAPKAFLATGPHVDAFLRACMIMQWRTKLVQFEYDPSDGEIRPIVEFPIEDGTVTAKQLGRCLHGISVLLDEYFETLSKALQTGEVEFPDSDVREQARALMARLQALLGETPEGGPGSAPGGV